MTPSNSPSFQKTWEDYSRFIKVHSAMEDFAVFPFLNTIESSACSHLPADHERDTQLGHEVDTAAGDEERERRVLAYREFMLGHLVAEEKVMMPLTQKSGATPKDRSMAFFVNVLAVTHTIEDFDWAMGWVIGSLSRKGSTEQPPLVATRVWVLGLLHACPPGLWERLRPTLKTACEKEIWDAFPELEGPGLLPLDAAQEAEAFKTGAETLQKNKN